MYELVRDKVYCRIFDKSFKQSTGIYNKFSPKNADKQQEIINNIQAVKKTIEAKKLFLMNQCHGTNFILVTNDTNMEVGQRYDGSVTSHNNLALGVYTADCVPVLLSNIDGTAIAAIHCGWRSARGGIIEKIIQEIRAQTTNNEPISAFIGPAIQQKSYEVDSTFYDDFINESAQNIDLFCRSNKPDHYMFDLVGYVQKRLVACAVNIAYICPDDTYELEEKYPSFRRFTHQAEPYNSNILSTIMIKPCIAT